MTTFTTEDRVLSETVPKPTWEERWGKEWVKAVRSGSDIQRNIVWFWPLTEQIPLDLEYGPTHLHYRAQGIAGVHSMPIQGSIHEFTTVAVAPITPSITITPTNSVGNLNLGGVSIGMENKPKWYQRALFKLLGFNWKDK
jgi:hypothetical protein